MIGMRGERNMWLSCTVLLRMLNVTPLEQQHEGEELGKEANNTRVAGLNVTVN